MRPSHIAVRCAVLVILFSLSAAWIACGDSRNVPPGPTPPPPPTPEVLRLEIVGPASIAPGGSAQYSAIQFRSDGSSGPATGVTWSSSQPGLLQVNASGLVTAQPPLRGEATLQAELPGTGRRASREILVLPDGTFRLVGTVTEADATSVPIVGAQVEALAEASISVETFATTGPDGRYALYGVPGDAELRVRKDGYITTSERIQLATHGTRNIQLRLENARLALAGDYRMLIEASRGCRLDGDLQRRWHDAVIAQNGPHLTVTLTSPPFLVDSTGQGNRFSGVVTTTGATFQMRAGYDFYYYPNNPHHPDVAELLPDGTVLVVSGTSKVTGTAGGLSGQVDGYLTLYRFQPGLSFPGVIYLSSCSASGLTLLRR